MDALIDFLPLLFVGAYYLLAGRRRAQQKRAMRERAQSPDDSPLADDAPRDAPPREATPFRSFLEQIEEAMAEAAGEPGPDPHPEPLAVQPVVEPLPEATSAPGLGRAPEFHPVSGSFDSLAPVDHAAHGFGADNPLSEEAFEAAPAHGAPSPGGDRGYDPHGLRPPPKTGRRRRDWQARLNDPQAAQDAFLLQTVFGPRGGRRAEHRR